MESLKPLLLLAVLGGVGYGVYVALNKNQPLQPALEEAPAWNQPVQVEAGTEKDRPPRELNRRSRDRSVAEQPKPRHDEKLARSTTREPATINPTPPASDPFTGLPKSDAVQPATSLGAVRSTPPENVAAVPPARDAAPMVGDRYRNTMTDNSPSLAPASGYSPAPPATSASAEHQEFERSIRQAETALLHNKLVDALRELTPWYAHPALSAEEQAQLVDMLGQLAGTVVYSREHWLGEPHKVAEGETLATIAEKYQIPEALLAKINGISDPASLRPGEELKIVRGPFHAELTADQQWLTLLVDGLYAGRFRVHAHNAVTGSDSALPVAKVPADHPSNAVRCRYISLGGSVLVIDTDGIERGTIPPPGSAGWMRLDPRDMDDVYNILSERSQVTLRR